MERAVWVCSETPVDPGHIWPLLARGRHTARLVQMIALLHHVGYWQVNMARLQCRQPLDQVIGRRGGAGAGDGGAGPYLPARVPEPDRGMVHK
jgi:hypothetical protein